MDNGSLNLDMAPLLEWSATTANIPSLRAIIMRLWFGILFLVINADVNRIFSIERK